MDLCQSRWEKKAHAYGKFCNYFGRILHHLSVVKSFTPPTKQIKAVKPLQVPASQGFAWSKMMTAPYMPLPHAKLS